MCQGGGYNIYIYTYIKYGFRLENRFTPISIQKKNKKKNSNMGMLFLYVCVCLFVSKLPE